MYHRCTTNLITPWLPMKAKVLIFQNLFSTSSKSPPGKHTKLWFFHRKHQVNNKWAKQTPKIYVVNSRTPICGKLTPEPLHRMPTTDCEKIQTKVENSFLTEKIWENHPQSSTSMKVHFNSSLITTVCEEAPQSTQPCCKKGSKTCYKALNRCQTCPWENLISDASQYVSTPRDAHSLLLQSPFAKLKPPQTQPLALHLTPRLVGALSCEPSPANGPALNPMIGYTPCRLIFWPNLRDTKKKIGAQECTH